jgi:hypothetical protein
MIIKQLSVFLENKSGRLTELTGTLEKNDINITALSVAETSEYGILRCIVSDPEKAVIALRRDGFSVRLTDVICVSIPNRPGALARMLRLLSDAKISVEYMYAFAVNEKALTVIRGDDLQAIITVLSEHKMELIKASDLYAF